MKKRRILTDSDGCVVYWEPHFHAWMQEQGYAQVRPAVYDIDHTYNVSKLEAERLVKEFNSSAWIGFCPPFKDARSGIARLVEHGYEFECITSVGNARYIEEMRWMNFRNLFGNDAFVELHCLDGSVSKRPTLERYRDSGMWWIEDHPKNARLGVEMGLNTILIDHPYNRDLNHPLIHRVNDWKEIVELITTHDNT